MSKKQQRGAYDELWGQGPAQELDDQPTPLWVWVVSAIVGLGITALVLDRWGLLSLF